LKIDISVIIPFYNSGLFIKEAIKSVENYSGNFNYEIIIINDGSTDFDSLTILKELDILKKYTILHQDNKGPGAARNFGCSIALGDFFLFLDSDNIIYQEYIDDGINELTCDISLAVFYGDAVLFGDNSRTGTKNSIFNEQAVMLTNYFDMCSIVRKIAFFSVGGFDEKRELLEDWDLWIRLFRQGWKFKYKKKNYFFYRITTGSLSTNRHSNHPSIVNVYKKHYDLLIQEYKILSFNYQIQNKDLNWSIRYILKKLKNSIFSK
jgi:glycosyltransferase involved in cell wall biosynthesis